MLALTACSQTEKPATTEPADYAETKEKLIQYPDRDSAGVDTSAVQSAMPAQSEPNLDK